jgi:tetratricopeptide (TPR) repeat protein
MKAKSSAAARILADAGVPRQRVASTLRKLVKALRAAPGDQESVTPNVAAARREIPDSRALAHAAEHFARGFALEATDIAAARAGYRAALATYRGHLEASINLGRLQHLNGELAASEKTYRAARHASAALSFNLALLLEDLHRDEEAARAYQDALAQDPTMHEAHLHLSLLHERRDRPREALMHLLAFRRKSQP